MEHYLGISGKTYEKIQNVSSFEMNLINVKVLFSSLIVAITIVILIFYLTYFITSYSEGYF